MSATSSTFESLVATIMSTPIVAVTQGQRECLKDWLARLNAVKSLTNFEDIKASLGQAPMMKLAGNIQIGATVRLTSMRGSNGNIGVNIGVGPVGLTGTYGFMSRSTEESVIQIAASFVLTNGESSLLDYLKNVRQLDLAKPEDVKTAIDKITEAIKALPDPTVPALPVPKPN